MSENPNELAGATQEPRRPEPNQETAREVFPVVFEKDYMDFRGVETPDEGELAPKSSSAPASVDTPRSVTGLEDLSEEESGSPAPTNAEKDKSPTTSEPEGSGSPTSSEATSTGKIVPPVSK